MRLWRLERGKARRFAIHAAVLSVVVGVTVVAIHRTPFRPSYRNVSFETCLADWKRCSGPVVIEGAYSPGSLRKGPECPSRLTMQSPGGTPEGKLDVCVLSSSVPDVITGEVLASPCGDDDTRMGSVVASGYYGLRVVGELDGHTFRADEVVGGGCEFEYYSWRYGEVAFQKKRE